MKSEIDVGAAVTFTQQPEDFQMILEGSTLVSVEAQLPQCITGYQYYCSPVKHPFQA
jgi:hypothetical protein